MYMPNGMVMNRLNNVVKNALLLISVSHVRGLAGSIFATLRISRMKQNGTSCIRRPCSVCATVSEGSGRITRQYTQSMYSTNE